MTILEITLKEKIMDDKIKITMGRGRRQRTYFIYLSQIRNAIKESIDKEDKKKWCK